MSAAKHTPGPWSVHPGGQYVGERIDGPSGRGLAHAITRDPHPTLGHGLSVDEAAANARLIAAAPDLLAACENTRDMLATYRQAFVDGQRLRDIRTEDPVAHGLVAVEDGVWITPEDAEALRDYDRALSLIDAAIAKATGSAT